MKLHLGCGKRYIEGFTHIDIAKYDHIDFEIPVDKLDIFSDNSIVEIYASHVIEYYDRDEVKDVLKEWKRVLKPGGLLRLAVPNFNSLIKVYDISNDLNKILGPLYGKWKTGDESIYHRTVYDKKSLTEVLLEAKFNNVQEWDWSIVFKDLVDYDDHSQAYFPHMDKSKGIHVSLNLECTK
jgi:predicted SAM-dependent methyltransferase